MNSKSAIRTVLLVALIPLALGGCNLFKSRSEWDKAVEARPLEIPPDLDAPPARTDLVVPEGSARATAAAQRGATGIDGLHVNDTVDSTWARVGMALERASIGAISARDEAGRTYSLTVTSKRTRDEGGFIKRLFTRKKVETITEQVNIGVSPDGNGSRVSVSGASASVQKVVAALRERLG